MPHSFKEIAMLQNDIMTFMGNKPAGCKLADIVEHLKVVGWSNMADHVAYNALRSMKKLGMVTSWKGEGRGDNWVAAKVQEKANKAIVEAIAFEPTLPSLMELNITVTREPPSISFLLNGVRITVNVP